MQINQESFVNLREQFSKESLEEETITNFMDDFQEEPLFSLDERLMRPHLPLEPINAYTGRLYKNHQLEDLSQMYLRSKQKEMSCELLNDQGIHCILTGQEYVKPEITPHVSKGGLTGEKGRQLAVHLFQKSGVASLLPPDTGVFQSRRQSFATAHDDLVSEDSLMDD